MAKQYWKIGEGITESTLKIELFEYAETQPAVRNFRVLDEVHSIAKTTEFHPEHIPASVELTIQDKQGYYYDKMDGKEGNTFMLVCTENSVEYFRGFVINPSLPQTFLKHYDKLTLVANDGVKGLDFMLNNYSGKIELGTLFYDLLSDIGFNYELNVLFNLRHYGAPGTGNAIQYLRVDPAYYVGDLELPSKYDLLVRLLAEFKLQLFQLQGAWWLMQRDQRAISTVLIYTYDSVSWKSDPETIRKIILKSELREEKDNLKSNLTAIRSAERIVAIPNNDFAYQNPFFEKWIGSEAVGWVGTGAISQLTSPSRMQFDTLQSKRSQLVPRTVRAGDTFRFRAKVFYNRKASLTDGSFTVGLGSVRAVSGLDEYYLKEDGSWTTSITEITRTWTSTSGVMSAYVPVDIDIITDPLPALFKGTIQSDLRVTGSVNQLVAGTTPRYEMFYVEASMIATQRVEYSFMTRTNTPNAGTVEKSSLNTDELSAYKYFPSREYYNGSIWQVISDFSTDGSNKPLEQVILESYVKSSSRPLRRLQLRLPFNYAVKMNQTIQYLVDGQQVLFTPISYKRYRKSRQVQIQMVELFSTGAVTTFKGLV